MDKGQLYSLQSSGQRRIGQSHPTERSLDGRNKFVIQYIKKCFGSCKLVSAAELSVGDGRFSRALLRSVPQAHLTCVDISSHRIDSIRNSASPEELTRLKFVIGDLDSQFDLLSDDQFQIVVALDIMEHVFDVFNFVSQTRRILKNGGLLVLRVPNIAYLKHRINLMLGRLPASAGWFGRKSQDITEWREFWGWDGGHLHIFTIPILIKLLNEYGYTIRLCRDPGTKFSRLRDLWPNLLYSNPVIFAEKGA